MDDFEARFWAAAAAPDANGCRVWLGEIDARGYGRAWGRGRQWRAHRAAYELATGSAPGGLFVCHRCDNRACVEPTHLFLGTAAQNTADMLNKGRQARASRHGSAKLTDADVLTIRSLRKCGETYQTIANRYGVTKTSVGDIVLYRTWRSV